MPRLVDWAALLLCFCAFLACGQRPEPAWAGAGASGASAGPGGGSFASGGKAIDRDGAYPDQTDLIYLSGKGTDDAIDWDFMINTGQKSGVWSKLPVPSNWEMHGFGTLAYGFNASTEVGTYRRSFELPASFAGKQVFIVFEGAMTDTQVSINGKSAGPPHQGGFYRFRYDLTSLLERGTNQLEVVVSEQSANASVNAAEREADYWTFGGIFRPVTLEAYPRQAIDRFAVNARQGGELEVDVRLRGLSESATVTARVFDDALTAVGSPLSADVAASATQVTLAGTFPGVAPWSAESPTRYRLAVELETRGGTRHALRQNFGFRTVEVRPSDGIYVNGTRVMLRGANRHSFWPDSGRALSPARSLADVQVIKDMNMNAVRNSHYPPDRHFLDAADAAGLFVLDELAGWQAPPYDTEIGRKLVEEMVTFNVNHPSILFWDNGNEGGWNTELDGDFARWDPQSRPVLHPWATFSSINTDHYESYASTKTLLGGNTLFMPTEFLHGLYDGGGGAGLDDYWKAMLDSPRGAGGFLWALVDEGVRRSATQIDTAGNAAPDGILGPYREKEGSYYTVREIWSPVQLAMNELSAGFTGEIPVENQYDATNLDTVKFEFELVRFDFASPTGGHTVVKEGTARTGSIPARSNGTLALTLPQDWRDAQALLVHAFDASGRSIGDWSFMVATPAEIAAKLVPKASAAAALATESDASFTVTAAETTFTFSKASGQLTSAARAGRVYSLRNGPALSVGSAALTSISGAQSGDDYVVHALYSGNLGEVVWRVLGNGWLALDYRYSLSGNYDFFGVDFDCAEADVQGATWLGKGPSRVWKNRLRGTWHDLWQRAKNDAVTGQDWSYPEFKGYFADLHFVRLATTAGPIDVVAGSPGLFLRLFTPRNGVNPMAAAMSFPAHDISFLHGIAPIGDKFLAPAALGPQGAQNAANGDYSATLYFHFRD
jgi:hypothetical protein